VSKKIIKKFIKYYWPIIGIGLLLCLYLFLAFLFAEAPYQIEIKSQSWNNFSIDIANFFTTISLFIFLVSWTSFIFIWMFSIYKYNLLFFDRETLLKNSNKIDLKLKKSISENEKILDINRMKNYLADNLDIEEYRKLKNLSNEEIIVEYERLEWQRTLEVVWEKLKNLQSPQR